MIVENETYWNTADLKAIVDATVANTSDAKDDPDKLIIFQTYRKPRKPSSWEKDRVVQTGWSRSSGTKIIKIITPKRNDGKNGTLTRVALAADGVDRELDDQAFVQLIEAVADTVRDTWRNRWYYGRDDEKKVKEVPAWAKRLHLRSNKKTDKNTPKLYERKIAEKEEEIKRIESEYMRRRDELRREIADVRKKMARFCERKEKLQGQIVKLKKTKAKLDGQAT